jgi:hypothetical protein
VVFNFTFSITYDKPKQNLSKRKIALGLPKNYILTTGFLGNTTNTTIIILPMHLKTYQFNTNNGIVNNYAYYLSSVYKNY